MKNTFYFLNEIEDFFCEESKKINGKKRYNEPNIKKVEERKNGRIFSMSDHICAMIYSYLSNNREWKDIERHINEIDRIFCFYDVEKIRKKIDTDSYQYFIDEITKNSLKCGNRRIKYQMKNLMYNIELFSEIEHVYGSMDKFVTSEEPEEILKKLTTTSSKFEKSENDKIKSFKIKEMGVPLASEYLRNVGIDIPKPDTHLCRFLGKERMGNSKKQIATEKEVFEQVKELSKKSGKTAVEIDNLIWSYCAAGYGEQCVANPDCENCCINTYCNRYD